MDSPGAYGSFKEEGKVMARLILSRRRGEKIRIGEDISIMIIDIRGDQVQIGIDAPRAIPVDREEVAKLKASGTAPRRKPVKAGRK